MTDPGPRPLRDACGIAPSAASVAHPPSEHFFHLYEDDSSLVDAAAEFVGAGLDGDAATVVLATPEHRHPLLERLRERGLDLGVLSKEGRFLALDAARTLSEFMVDGRPDPARFHDVVGGVVRRASLGGSRPVRAFGEMVALLWADGKRDAALGVERLWNEVGRKNPLSLFCAYPMRGFGHHADTASLLEVCEQHGHVLPTGAYADLETPEERLRMIAVLQQKATALEGEVARRKDLEETLRRRDEEMAAILEDCLESVLDVHPDGTVLWANRTHLGRVGYGASECVGRRVGELLVAPRAADEVWGRLLRAEPVGDVRLAFRAKDGSVRPAHLRTGFLRTSGGTLHMRWFLRDLPG